MNLHRRNLIATLPALAAAAALPLRSSAAKDSAVLAMVLEPPTLDPTTGAAAAIGEIVHYNVFEGLTRIDPDGKVRPLLAQSAAIEDEGKTYVFKLRRDAKFSDGEAFDSSTVKFSFERAKAADSTNKAKKAVFDNIEKIETPSSSTLILRLTHPDGNFLFRLAENTAVILHPKTAAQAATKPVGTGPYLIDEWKKGVSISLVKNAGFRDPKAAQLERVSFRFINDPAARVAALLAGDIDAVPRLDAPDAVRQLQADDRFKLVIGSTAGKGIVAINNKRKPLDDVRVRRALSYAIDRKAFIDGVLDGLAKPIGSHFAPTDAGYVDLTGVHPYDPDKAKALLKEAGVALPLKLTLTLPPPQYARKGGEVVAAMLAQVGVEARIENVEWAQWLSGPFKGNFDLTIINHVEPLDFMQYTNKEYYWGYSNPVYDRLCARYSASTNPKEKLDLFAQIQRQLATDAVNVYLFNPANVSVAKKGLSGVWTNSPIFANDLAALRWD